jgi:hypothetical protein
MFKRRKSIIKKFHRNGGKGKIVVKIMNNFDVIGVFSGIIGVIFAVVFVESIYIKIIISLSILVVLLIIKIILLHKDNKILTENLADAKKITKP